MPYVSANGTIGQGTAKPLLRQIQDAFMRVWELLVMFFMTLVVRRSVACFHPCFTDSLNSSGGLIDRTQPLRRIASARALMDERRTLEEEVREEVEEEGVRESLASAT